MSEITSDYYNDANVQRWLVKANSAKLPGASSTTGHPWVITGDELPAALLDSDEATSDTTGAPTLRASTDILGINQIPLHILSFTPLSGGSGGGATAEIWTNTGAYTAGADVDVYLWWNKAGKTQPAVGATYGQYAVYQSSYLFYHHLADDPTDGTVDATSNGQDTTDIGTMLTADLVTGKVVDGIDFDGTDDGLVIASPTFPAIGNDFAVGIWSKAVDQAGSGFPSMAVTENLHSTLSGMFFDYNDSTDKYRLSIRNTSVSDTFATAVSVTSVSFGTFQHVVGRFDDSAFECEIFIDGASEHTHAASGTRSSASGSWGIGHGRFNSANVDFYQGVLDEHWLYNGTLTDNEITTIYNNQSSPSAFWDTTAAVVAGPFGAEDNPKYTWQYTGRERTWTVNLFEEGYASTATNMVAGGEMVGRWGFTTAGFDDRIRAG